MRHWQEVEVHGRGALMVPCPTTMFLLTLLLPQRKSHKMPLHASIALQKWKRNEIMNKNVKKVFIRDQDCCGSNKLILCSSSFYCIFISFQLLQFSFLIQVQQLLLTLMRNAGRGGELYGAGWCWHIN